MPIEKLKFNADIMNYSGRDLKRWELTNVDIVVMDKINELIDFINTRDQDRSEQMARMIDRVTNIESNHEGFKESTIHQVNCLLKNIKEIEKATQPKEEEPLSCPWCNELPHMSEGYSILLSHPPKFNYIIQCINTKCLVNPKLAFSFSSQQEAIEAWNKRA